jgi:hypothetical protein
MVVIFNPLFVDVLLVLLVRSLETVTVMAGGEAKNFLAKWRPL